MVGEINPDIVVADPDPVPRFGEIEKFVESIRMVVGSSSVIFAYGATKLGLSVSFFGVVGDDSFGQFMLGDMRRIGIDVSACRVDPERPTAAGVILTTGKDRAILTSTGALGVMDVREVPQDLLGRATHIHSGAFYLQQVSREHLPRFFAEARERGTTTSFDTNYDPAGAWDEDVLAMLQSSDVFLPNAVEALQISGETDVESAARALARIGARGRADGGPVVVVKLGADGAIAYRLAGQLARVPAMPVDVVDTTGAGDSFDAGFVRAWLDGADLQTCLRWGAVAGAMSTRGHGGTGGQATSTELEAALARWAEDTGWT